MNQATISLTRCELLKSDPPDRVRLVEEYALNMLSSGRTPGSTPLHANSRLADAGMDSLQVVELKFSLDELLGRESEVEMFISNPTIRELAGAIVLAAGL
jgi:acyl carrier protein